MPIFFARLYSQLRYSRSTEEGAMSTAFRDLLKKIGSGTHTSESLTRPEAADATRMMLNQEAAPAQIGAFLIAHRIRRPTGEELAGMLDAYDVLGPQIAAIDDPRPVAVFSVPYDGRTRTATILPITALILATAGYPVVMHGGDRMATKYGVPLIELWQALGVDWTGMSLEQLQQSLQAQKLAFVYTPRHFPALQPLVEIRDQLGKRPPIATLELIWCPYAGDAHLVSGYVHPPTEKMMQDAFALRGQALYTAVKGLEGSCDLPRDRTAIIGAVDARREVPLERLLLSARDVGLQGAEVPYTTLEDWVDSVNRVLVGQEDPLLPEILWNGGFYLWHLGVAPTLKAGVEQTRRLLQEGQVRSYLEMLQRQVGCDRYLVK
jgi:anthranilate phosphoribosyltransferase